MNNGKKIIQFDVPSADNNLTTNPPEIEMFDDAGSEQEFSNAGGYGFWVSQKKADKMKSDGKNPMFGKGIGNFFKQAWFRTKEATLAPTRAAYLGLLKLNAFGMSTKLANMKKLATTKPNLAKAYDDILTHWVKFGGDKNIFEHNVDLGKTRKELLVRASKQVKLLKFEGEGFSNVVGETAALVTAATPITIYVVKTLTDHKDDLGPLAMNPADQAAMIAQANAVGIDPTETAQAKAQLELQKGTDSEKNKKSNMLYYIIGGTILVGILGFIAYKHYHKK